MEKFKGLIALCGGIGSGKSVVSKILDVLGYPVYDCDSRARDIMDNDAEIHISLCKSIHPMAVVDGRINRRLISDIVFSDDDALKKLNAIVHSAVKLDLMRWCEEKKSAGFGIFFVETAILRQSGLIDIVDDLWVVTAPELMRVERVQRRSGLTESQVRARMKSQQNENFGDLEHKEILNDYDSPLLPQIHEMLGTV